MGICPLDGQCPSAIHAVWHPLIVSQGGDHPVTSFQESTGNWRAWRITSLLHIHVMKSPNTPPNPRDAVKVLHSICQQIWKTQQWPQDCKRSVFIPIPKKGNDKECSNYHIITLISHASKVMLKILQARV